MESFSNLSFEMKQRASLYKGLKQHAEGVKRDQSSPVAAGLAADLENSILKGERLLDEIETRLYEALSRIANDAEEIIGAERDIIQDCLSHQFLADPTDNLIVSCLLWHARRHPQEPKAFLSGDSADFGRPGVVATHNSAGIKYFKEVRSATGWLRSQPESGSG
jgi:hypothetical protein